MRPRRQLGSEKEGAVRRQRLLPVTSQQRTLPLGQTGDERAGQWGAAGFAATAARTPRRRWRMSRAGLAAGAASAASRGHCVPMAGAFLFRPACGSARHRSPCPAGVGVASRDTQAPPQRKSCAQEGAGSIPCPGEAGGYKPSGKGSPWD